MWIVIVAMIGILGSGVYHMAQKNTHLMHVNQTLEKRVMHLEAEEAVRKKAVDYVEVTNLQDDVFLDNKTRVRRK